MNERDKKLQIFDKHKEYASFDELLNINDKLEAATGILNSIEEKDNVQPIIDKLEELKKELKTQTINVTLDLK